MCGRFVQYKPVNALGDLFAVPPPWPNHPPRYNVAPTDQVLAVRYDPKAQRRSLDLLHWGLVPLWAKDRKGAARLINARCETASSAAPFREAFATRRCLIPAEAFYEWQKREGGKQPFAIGLAEGGTFAFAGLWERWRDGEEIFRSCTILTSPPNALLAPIHDRMPVILAPGSWPKWLGEEPTAAAELQAMLRPFPAEAMRAYPVRAAVGKVANQGPELLEPA